MCSAFRKYVLISLLGLLLNNCSLFETPSVKPQVRPPKQWKNYGANFTINESRNLPDTAWWREFNDPQLNLIIEKALQQNNQVNIAIANLEYAQNELKQVKLNWLPGMNLLTGYSQMPIFGSPDGFIALLPSYTLNLFQQIKQQQHAQYQVEASRYAKDSVRLTVIGQVSSSYFILLAQEEDLQLYQQLLKENNKLLKLYHSQYRAGITAQDDIDKLNSQINQLQSQIVMTRHNIHVSKNALHYLLNQNPGDWIVNTSFKQINSNKVVPGNLPLTVLNNRPDVQQAEAALKAADANIGKTAAGLLPSIQLDAFMNYGSATNHYSDYKEAYLNTPLFNPVFGEIKASQSAYKAQYYQYIDTIKRALRDVENDLSAYSASSEQLNNNLSAFSNEEKNCDLVRSRYRYGIDSEVDAVQCQIKLNTFKLMLSRNKLEKMLTIVALYQDLGGGYHAD